MYNDPIGILEYILQYSDNDYQLILLCNLILHSSIYQQLSKSAELINS